MSFCDDLCDDAEWDRFLEYRTGNGLRSERENAELEKFVGKRLYRGITEKIRSGEYAFPAPRRKSVSKTGTDKRRTVYSFGRRENTVLKMAAFLLHRYDGIFPDSLYSYRQDLGVKEAVRRLTRVKDLRRKYCYKADIRDYFNSVDTGILLPELEDTIEPDEYRLISCILLNPYVRTGKETVREEKKGIMAGLPISAFLANFYLMDMDRHFSDLGIFYARYADDIIVLADTPGELREYREYIHSYLKGRGLEINPRKKHVYSPGDTIEFLGFGICGRRIDLAETTVRKTKAKIRRAARSITRWGGRKNIDRTVRMEVMIQKFARIFYGAENGELSWEYWYFPTLNTADGLRIVDGYLQERIRWIGTGRSSTKNRGKVPYSLLKEMGYVPLVHAYYERRKGLIPGDVPEDRREDA